MEISTQEQGDALVVSVLERRIDAAVVIRFKEQMRAIVDGGAPRVILDLSQVEFLDSSGLGAVVSVMKHMGPERRLELARLTPTVQKVFRLTRMDSVFTIHQTLARDGIGHAV